MSDSLEVLRAGTRSSRLALVQTRGALQQLQALLPHVRIEETALSSPGDRDQQTDLRESPPDFFTRDLDEKVRSGELGFAIHSAKDLPDPVPEGIDWCWLPWREDPRDVVIRPCGSGMADMPPDGVIGVSSDRREAYCLSRFPEARQIPIRGNIEERLQQLDEGRYDLVVMAAAALNRLGLQDRITEWIPLADLPTPDGQGVLAMTFREGDERFLRLRGLFVKAVTFAAAGVGSSRTCTLEALAALRRCDVCLYDTLMGEGLLDYLPPGVERIDVGKRCGQHTLPQEEITTLIAVLARRGRRVVRLKGGDPGMFGRLAEEVEALDALQLPYRVLPGITSLTAATTGTGILLTRRDVSRGFCVMTPRRKGGGLARVTADERARLPIVFFMGVSVSADVARQLIEDGLPVDTPAAIVFDGGSDQAEVVSGTLATIGELAVECAAKRPGLLIVGDVVRYRYGCWGALRGCRVLLTASRVLQDKAAGRVADYGGVPVCRSLIELVVKDDVAERMKGLHAYDWIVLTSPSSVRCFGEALAAAGVDLRRVPALVTCGGGTSEELRQLGLAADIEPASNFGGEGLLEAVKPHRPSGRRVLRLRSDKAGPNLAEQLRKMGAEVDDCVLYENVPVSHEKQPVFDAVFFASASAVEVFDQQWGIDAAKEKTVVAIGKPTVAALNRVGVQADVVPPEATVDAGIRALAEHVVRQSMMEVT